MWNEDDTPKDLVVAYLGKADNEKKQSPWCPNEHNVDEWGNSIKLLCERSPRTICLHVCLEANEEDSHNAAGHEVSEEHCT